MKRSVSLSPCDPRLMKVPEDFCQQVDSESDSESEAESAPSLSSSSASSSSTEKKTGFEHICGAHRWKRLVWLQDGKIKDEETGQCFDVIQFGLKNEKRNRLLPVFDKMPRDAWKLKFGFHMMKTYLKCIPPNCILWSKNNKSEMQQLEFLSCNFKAISKIDVKCLDHDEVVQVRPHELKKGASLSCSRCCLQKRTWNNRFDEFKSILPRGYELMIGRDEWKTQCKNIHFCPPIRCIKHPDRIITTTTVISIFIGKGVGCMQCNNTLNTWKHRFDDFKTILPSNVELVTTREEWENECDSCYYRPKLRCLVHPHQIVQNTMINSIQKGQGIGCVECCSKLNIWRYRFDEFKSNLPQNIIMRTTKEEWERDCSGTRWCPTFECAIHPGKVIITTQINGINEGQGLNCEACARKWKTRYEEFKSKLPACVIMHTSKDEWESNCTGALWCPIFECALHPGILIRSTSITGVMHKGPGINCLKCLGKKTERKFQEWIENTCILILKQQFPELKNIKYDTQAKGPYVDGSRWPTHYDFELFDDGFKVRIEVDGQQHFDKSTPMFTMQGCHRDKAKEEHSIEIDKVPMIRVLQRDVWAYKNAWDDYCIRSIKKLHSEWKEGKAPCIVLPPGNRWEYCDPDRSVYAQLRID